jgi:uncharacterized protein
MTIKGIARPVVFLFILCFFSLAAHAALQFPPLTGRVVDDAHILSASTVQTLTAQLAAAEQSTGDQIVVVTLPSLQGQTVEDYGYQLGRAWGIGQKGKDNGALIIVAPTEHKTRIEVGYGLEGTLTDALTSTIINQAMLPAFKAGQYDKGVSDGTDAVLSAIGAPQAGNDGALQSAAPQADAQAGNHFNILQLFLFLIVLFFILRSRTRSSFLAPFVLGTMMGRSGGGFEGGSGGGFSGGGGGFGGGGASGSW